MPLVLPSRGNIFFEEIQSGAAASEDTMSKIGGSVNFWNSYYEGSRGWFLNGPYSVYGPQSGLDGAYGALFKMEVIGVFCYNLVTGTSGTTQFDLTVYPPSGPSFSLFSTRPAISWQAGNNARIIYNARTSSTVFASAWTTAPVLATTVINAGSMVTFSITQVQSGASNCGLVLFLQPKE